MKWRELRTPEAPPRRPQTEWIGEIRDPVIDVSRGLALGSDLYPGRRGLHELTAVALRAGEVSIPRRAVIQRLAAVAGPLGRLPEAAGDGPMLAGIDFRFGKKR
jgi:hypothetical protein